MDLLVLDHEVRRATQVILQTINKTLRAFPSDLTKEVVMQKVLSNPIMTNVIPNPCTISKEVFVEKCLLYGLVQFLLKVKRMSTSTKLVTKHAILTALVNGIQLLQFGKKLIVEGSSSKCCHGYSSQGIHAIIQSVLFGTINTEKEGKHLGSSYEGDRFIMVGYRNSNEFELERCGEQKSSTPCVQRETNSISHGNASILHHPYFFILFIISFAFSLQFVSLCL